MDAQATPVAQDQVRKSAADINAPPASTPPVLVSANHGCNHNIDVSRAKRGSAKSASRIGANVVFTILYCVSDTVFLIFLYS